MWTICCKVIGRTMLANSDFIVMQNQASTDRMELDELLNTSDLQLSFITNVDAGNGLIKVGSSLVPFTDKFPRHTKLYRLGNSFAAPFVSNKAGSGRKHR
ncbi:hypothetical protein [Brevibacillus reuszeri]|uniref:hypothetical protein n=1 Tax=Brevibacillus reuszeri TaxID=54915 RepID=UPI003D24EF68